MAIPANRKSLGQVVLGKRPYNSGYTPLSPCAARGARRNTMVRFVIALVVFFATFTAAAEETCNDGADCVGRCESRAFSQVFCCGGEGPGYWGRDQEGDPISCEAWANWNRQAREKIRLETEQMTKSLCTIKENGESCYKLSCLDGTYADICDGKDGTNGTDGQNGTSCTVKQTSLGATIECTDGMRAMIHNGKDVPASAIKIGPLAGVGYRLVGSNTHLLNSYVGVELGAYGFRTAVTVGTIFGLAGENTDASRKIAGEIAWLVGYAQDEFGIFAVGRWNQWGEDPAWGWDLRGISPGIRAEFRPLALFPATKRYADLLTICAEGGYGPTIIPGMSFADAAWLTWAEFGLKSAWLF